MGLRGVSFGASSPPAGGRFLTSRCSRSAARFLAHADDGLWNFIPVNEALLRRTSALVISAPRELFLRTADAVHLTTAQELGERDVWTNNRHMLAAASYFGLAGRSV
jgi:hypothetical protein